MFSFTVLAISLKGLRIIEKRKNKVDDSIFRFVILSSLMVSKHRKETTQKTENITFTRC